MQSRPNVFKAVVPTISTCRLSGNPRIPSSLSKIPLSSGGDGRGLALWISALTNPAKQGSNRVKVKDHSAMDKIKPAPVKPTISFDVFDKIDIRVGTIRSVKDVPKADKLVSLTVDFGDHQRIILAGIKKEREDPKEIEEKQALFVVNLEPRKMMGHISEGMLFDLGYADGLEPALAVPERVLPNGTRAG